MGASLGLHHGAKMVEFAYPVPTAFPYTGLPLGVGPVHKVIPSPLPAKSDVCVALPPHVPPAFLHEVWELGAHRFGATSR